MTWFRLGAAVAIVMASTYVLQGDHSAAARVARTIPASKVAPAPIATWQVPVATKDYFIAREAVIPTGATTIQLPILMYHYIRTPPSQVADLLGYRLSVSPQSFQAQMSWLAMAGYHPVTLDDVRSYFAGKTPLPAKPVIITFDDGYADLYTNAYPILLSHGFKAVAYVVTNFVGQRGYLTKAEILEMDHNRIEIASHTVNHPNLARSSYGSVVYELVASKRWLEALLGHPVLDFAYPSGQFNLQVIDALQSAGYDTAVTVDFTTSHTWAGRYTWGRVRVGGGEAMPDFVAGLGVSMRPTLVTALSIPAVAANGPPQAIHGL